MRPQFFNVIDVEKNNVVVRRRSLHRAVLSRNELLRSDKYKGKELIIRRPVR